MDAASRTELGDALEEALDDELTVVQVAHRPEDVFAVRPTKALVLRDGGHYDWGDWEDLEDAALASLSAAATESERRARDATLEEAPPQKPDPKTVGRGARKAWGKRRAPDVDSEYVVELRNVTVSYGSTLVLDGLTWRLERGENSAVLGPNGSGKSTLLDLITGDCVQGFRQDLSLFGKRKGSGESIWDIKRRIGALTPASHMEHADYADPTVRQHGANGAKISSLQVVLSGFFDSVGLYDTPTAEHLAVAKEWARALGLDDLVDDATCFCRLSLGQQKLVLLCRALVKSPSLLILDEPTHGLSKLNRGRLLDALRVVTTDPDIAVLYVTHRQDEVDALDLGRVLRLSKPDSGATRPP